MLKRSQKTLLLTSRFKRVPMNFELCKNGKPVNLLIRMINFDLQYQTTSFFRAALTLEQIYRNENGEE